MLTKLRLLFSITIVFLSFSASAQSGYWERSSAQNRIPNQISQRFNVQKGNVFAFRESLFREELKAVSKFNGGSKIVYFPNEEGESVGYRVFESPVFSPRLSEKYPQIKSYKGYSVDDPADRVRFSVSHKEIQAMIVHGDGRANSFIQKAPGDQYVLYSRESGAVEKMDFVCATKDKVLSQITGLTAKPVDGQVLRKYRLAVSATAEYTIEHGGSISDALAAINATVTRINEVFETDLAVTLELVADTDKVIYTDESTDPYGGLSTLGSLGQQAFTDEIGEENYDIGHVFHKGPNGGNAGFIGAICIDNRKGSAYSSSQIPEGDTFDLDFVAHEMGHQMGANHTWSYELEGTLVQVEPGSGSTIMGYAGITENDNVTPNGDDYFHYVSIEQIIETLRLKNCGEIIPITNNPPVVSAVDDYVIPKSTAFILTGSATDPDIEDVLTYAWEQIDNGVVTRASFGPNNPSGANFRSRPPITDPTRYFPMLSRVIEGNIIQENPDQGSAWETVSDVEREMNFALTVRDNSAGGGQVVSDLVNILVSNSAGPFMVTSQTSTETYLAGEALEITWDVASTNLAPVDTETVDILLSTDGGETFPIVLAQGVNNDGSHEMVVPGMSTSEARIMVKAVDNIFFAVNSEDFIIEASEIVMNFTGLEFEVCQFSDLTVPFTYETFMGFSEEVTFSVTDPPVGLNIFFSPPTATADDTAVDLIIENTENVPEGNYPITITATSASISKSITAELNIFEATFNDVTMLAPTNGSVNISTVTPLHWEENISYTAYDVQIATDASFTTIVEVANVAANSYTPTALENSTTYFWRVKPENACGEGTFNSPFSFSTIPLDCDTINASGLPLAISNIGTPKIVSTVAFFEDLPIADINVNLDIDHDYLADLVVSITSPSGTTITLISNSCGDLKNVDATFDDDAENFICGVDANDGIKGTVRPLGSLNSLRGESILGEWILEVADNASSDGGSLNSFSLDICVEGTFRPDADNDGVFDDGDDLCLDTPEGSEVDSSGCPFYRFPSDNFTVSIESESCRNNDDGIITIDAFLPLDYELAVTGNGLNITDNFTATYSIANLTSGTYNLCISGTDANFEYEPYCFEVEVVQPDPLGVTSKITDNGKQVALSMIGADRYTIELNGKTIQTEKSEINLDLQAGSNVLRISTDMPCQGTFEDYLFISEKPVVFPNPFVTKTGVFLGSTEAVQIDIFTIEGRLLKSGHYVPNRPEIELDFMEFPSGTYFIKFKGAKVNGTIQVIKR